MRLTITGDTSVYQFLWLRYVTGFDHTKHCAFCLRSKRDPRVTPRLPTGVSILLGLGGAPFAYLCGVTRKGWSTNTHLVMVPDKHGEVELTGHAGVRFTCEGARSLPIPELPKWWQGLPDSFTTCRNFRFGVEYFGYPEVSSPYPKKR